MTEENLKIDGVKAIIAPGNGNPRPEDNWNPYVKSALERLGIPTINVKFPDSVLARRSFWLPFLKELGTNERTIIIGHSSGAIAAMRYAEKDKILGSVLVGAYYTDLDDESEKKSGYFDDHWDWELKPSDNAHPEARWVAKNEVYNLLTHPKDKAFFQDILFELKNLS